MTDYLSKEGAITLSETIQDYWFLQGVRVETRIEAGTSHGASIYTIRSNLINGKPQGNAR